MYRRSARLYDAQYSFLDHAGAADRIVREVRQVAPDARTLLDVGCATGLHLERLRETLEVEGLDINPELLAVARDRCPGVPLHEADMRTFDLGRRFDVITCLFGALAYVKTREALLLTVERFAHHLAPGGVLIVEPFFSPEAYWTGHLKANFLETPDLKLAWMYIQEREDDLAILDHHYLVASSEGIESFVDRHELGLFSRADHEAAFSAAGLNGEFDPNGYFTTGRWLATRAG